MVLAYAYRDRLFGLDLPIRIACVIALVILGWAFAMNLGRAIGPTLMSGSGPARPAPPASSWRSWPTGS